MTKASQSGNSNLRVTWYYANILPILENIEGFTELPQRLGITKAEIWIFKPICIRASHGTMLSFSFIFMIINS